MDKAVKILLVEDSEDDAILAIRMLRRGGFDVRHERVASAVALEAALQREPWDAVIADFSMPGFTGLDALEILKASGLDIPFILTSGVVGEETAVAAMRAGAGDYLMKENLARLVPALEREMQEAATRAENRQAQRKLAGNVALTQLLEVLARAANEAGTPEAALNACVERIGEYGGWIIGHILHLVSAAGAFNVTGSLWRVRERERFSKFIGLSDTFSYGRHGGGIVGKVVRERRPVWIADLAQELAIPRLAKAHEAGLRAGLAFPVIVHDQVVACIEFFATEPRPSDDALLEALPGIAAQLARLFERQQALEQMRHAHQQMQLLSRRVLEVQEAERRGISRTLHDEIGQDLAALRLQIEMAAHQAAAQPLRAQLTACSAMVERAIQQVRDLSHSLRPAQLDDFGLAATLRSSFEAQAQAAGLTLRFSAAELDGHLPPNIEIACFRVAQEALTNIVRHARAREIRVRLDGKDGVLRLNVSDDGCGFDVAGARANAVKGGNLGLISMRERVELSGGTLELSSIPGQGTELLADFPLRESRPAP